MYNNKYVSIKQVAANIKRGKLYKDIQFETVIAYAVHALRLIMQEKYFITKPEKVKIEAHKGKLPCDFELMIQCTKHNVGQGVFIPMRYGTDTFSAVYNVTGSPDLKCHEAEFTYVINNGVITTNFADGDLFMVYKAIHSDSEGYPLIPDEVNVMKAVEFYVKYNYLNDLGTEEPAIERRMNKDEQEYCWYVGKAQAAATNMTMDEWEAFGNSMSQLFTNPNQFKDRMKNLGMQEYIKLH